jgi:hypothetical protein
MSTVPDYGLGCLHLTILKQRGRNDQNLSHSHHGRDETNFVQD